ncbi:MAG: histidine kinase, region domain protein [Nocardioides sp.]|nr:histidine kinase, region domain protein [Nocardioides sp.]
MRERLTVSFIAITLLMLIGAGLIRSWVTDSDVRNAEREDAQATASAVAVVVADELAEGGAVDEALLTPFATPRVKLTYAVDGAPDVVVGDRDASDAHDEVTASVVVRGGGTLTVGRHHDESLEGIWGNDTSDLLALFGLLAVVSGLVGYLVARSLSGPFRQLAVAAAALGRGRFDLDLPRGGVPEARAIASALEQSAGQLRERLERERAFVQHASHVLRTPLTSLRFRLEELVDDPGLSLEARDAAEGCLKAVGQLNDVAGELVELGGRGVLVAGAAIPLRDLATQVAQRWADALDETDRELTAAVEGDIELVVTPGPVEQVLDLILEDLVAHETGSVRLVFEGAASRLRVDILCRRGDDTMGAPLHPVQDRVHTVLDSLGGRLEHPADGDVLRLHLPRR